MTRQKYKRFDVDACQAVGMEVALPDLIGATIVESSATTYDSRLRTLGRTLKKLRGDQDADPRSCTEYEFVQFLWNWKKQGMGPARGISAALLLEQRKLGAQTSFLTSTLVKKLVKGAAANHTPMEKGVLDGGMVMQWRAATWEAGKAELGIPCSTCTGMKVSTKRLRKWIVLAGDFMKEVAVRPGNLRDVRDVDLLDEGFLNVLHPKRQQQGRLIMSQRAVEIFKEALALSDNEFVFPRCIRYHLDLSLRWAECLYNWPLGLVFSPHCLRHTHIEGKAREVETKLKELLTGITGRTIAGYAVPLEVRTSNVGKKSEKRGREGE